MTTYIAQPYIAGSPEALVIGQTMLAFVENMQGDLVKPIMEKHGIAEIDPEGWYSHQTWMDVLKEIGNTLQGEASMTFVAIGKQVVEAAVMPPEMKTIPDALNALHAIHHLNLRNIPQEEGYHIEKIADNHYHVYENTPNPSDVIYGFIWGLAQRFRGPGERFIVQQIDNPNPAEKPGTIFEVRWGIGL